MALISQYGSEKTGMYGMEARITVNRQTAGAAYLPVFTGKNKKEVICEHHANKRLHML